VPPDATDCPWGPPSLLFDGYRGTSPTVKRPELDIDQSPLSSPEVRNVWIYTSTLPILLCLHGGVMDNSSSILSVCQMVQRSEGEPDHTSVWYQKGALKEADVAERVRGTGQWMEVEEQVRMCGVTD
jgi:hypothetical protein